MNLANKLRLLETSIRRTKQRLSEFEDKYRLTTGEFIRRFENDKFEANWNWPSGSANVECWIACVKK